MTNRCNIWAGISRSRLRAEPVARLGATRFDQGRNVIEWLLDLGRSIWLGTCWHLWHKEHGCALEIGGRIIGIRYDKRCLKCGRVQKDRWLPL